MKRGNVTTLRGTLGVQSDPNDRCDGCSSSGTSVWRVNIGGMWSYLCPSCRHQLAEWLTEEET